MIIIFGILFYFFFLRKKDQKIEEKKDQKIEEKLEKLLMNNLISDKYPENSIKEFYKILGEKICKSKWDNYPSFNLEDWNKNYKTLLVQIS